MTRRDGQSGLDWALLWRGIWITAIVELLVFFVAIVGGPLFVVLSVVVGLPMGAYAAVRGARTNMGTQSLGAISVSWLVTLLLARITPGGSWSGTLLLLLVSPVLWILAGSGTLMAVRANRREQRDGY